MHTDKVTTLVPFFWDGKCLHFTPAFSKPQGITQLDFHLELLNRLTGNYSLSKTKQDIVSTDIQVPDCKSHFATCVTLNRCAYCPLRGQRHRSSWGCALCAVTLCGGCFEHYSGAPCAREARASGAP